MNKLSEIDRDSLFENLLRKLNAHRHLILAADQGWGIQDYVKELGFQLAEKHADIHVCYLDIKKVYSPESFVELFVAVLSHRFPEVTSELNPDRINLDMLKLPALIAKRKKIRVALFIANSHLLRRFSNHASFLRSLKLKLKSQKKCIFCLYGYNPPDFLDLLEYPGPLFGLGQLHKLVHNPFKHRSACIRRLFHDHQKKIGHETSNYMSFLVENDPFYLNLLAWHALIRTRTVCTKTMVNEALDDLILHFDLRFIKLSDSLTQKQLNFLKALIGGNQMLFAKATRDKYQLGTTSNVARIKQCLERKELIHTLAGETVISDPIYSQWLRRCLFAKS